MYKLKRGENVGKIIVAVAVTRRQVRISDEAVGRSERRRVCFATEFTSFPLLFRVF